MFSSKKTDESAVTSSRLRRAQELRQKRHGKGGPAAVASKGKVNTSSAPAANQEEDTMVVSGICTLICSFVIVCFGAGIATLFFMVHQPDCMQGLSLSFDMASAKSFAAPDVVRGSTTAVVPKVVVLNAEPQGLRRKLEKQVLPTTSSMPGQCSAEHLAILAQQLPAGGCERVKEKPWIRAGCSFSAATACTQPTWFRDHFASIELGTTSTFTAIIVGCKKGIDAMNLLKLGSKDNGKEWIQSGDNCPSSPMPTFENSVGEQKAQVFCVEAIQSEFDALTKTKQARGLADNELILDQVALGDNTLDQWSSGKEGLKDDAPIHYLSLNTEGNDFDLLVGAARNLKRVHYLDLYYHWHGTWGKRSLTTMIERLKAKEFVCYWPGTENKLWRITDCWQDHYELHFWSRIACVNTLQAPVLAREMEALFQHTLQNPNLSFGQA